MKTSLLLKKGRQTGRMVFCLILLAAFLGISAETLAQNVATIGAGAQSGTSSNSATGDPGPMYRSTNTSNFVYSRYHYLYTQAELAAAGITAGVNITKLAWNKDLAAATNSPATFQIWIKNSAKTTVGAGGQNWADLIQGSTQVYNNSALTMTSAPQWHEFVFNAPFLYTGGAIEISVNFDISSGTSPWTTAGFSWTKDPITDRTLSYVGSTAPAATLPNLRTVRPQIQITYGAAGPCTAPPTAGTATTTNAVICPNTSFMLNVTGNSTGAGQTYQWQSSPTGTAPWTPVGPSSNSTIFTTTQTSTRYYQLAVTCSGQTTTSVPVLVTTNATPVSGTFTINKANPTAGTNFSSFADAITAIECGGVNGPLVFNVVANSGPYLEHVTIPVIPGASATNTITFNGNGNTLRGTSTAGTPVLKLDGADYIRVNNLTVESEASATAGQVLHLTNGADNNLFTGNTFKHSTSTTSTSHVVYIYTGSNNNNTFTNNTITGGYYGVYNYGASGTVHNANQFIGNTINDQYAYGIYNYYATNSLIEGNDISRPTRTAVTSMYGITASTGVTGTTISKNRIHNSHDAATSLTGLVYGIYITGADATVGNENVVKNNLVYNINNTGTVYGIYSTSADGNHNFHNTIVLNNAANTGTVRGIYQTTAATNIKVQNNIVVVDGGASGAKHALYYATTTSGITSNNNVLYVTGSANIGSWGTAASATLAAWQTASSQDANSVSANPQFVNPATGDFRPSNVAVNNIGTPVGVTDDITGATRSTTTPDPGAYEFSVNPNDVGVTAITGISSGCGLTASQTVTITVKNFGSAPQSNVQVSYTLSGTATGSGAGIITGPIAPNATATFSFTTTVNLSAPGPYTLTATTSLTGDADPTNDSFTLNVSNALIPTLPIRLDFETPASGIGAVQVITNSKSTVVEAAGASNGAGSTKGMIMAGINATNWVTPVGVIDPWTSNGDQFSAVKMCINPSAGPAKDSLFMEFDLKQLYKGSNSSTNFRVTVNGTQVGPTYNPPFSGTPIVWQRIRVDLTPYKTLSSLEIALESSVKEEYAGGAGTANLIDNLVISRHATGLKSDILAAQVNVFPNPGTGIFNVTAPKGNFQVEVLDLTGKTLLQQNADGNATQLNLKEAAKGIYLLKITSEGSVATKRLVIE